MVLLKGKDVSVSKALKDINDSLNKSKGDAEDLAELKAKEPKNKVEKSAAGVAKGLEPVSKNVVDSKDAMEAINKSYETINKSLETINNLFKAYEGLSVKKSMTDAAKAPKKKQDAVEDNKKEEDAGERTESHLEGKKPVEKAASCDEIKTDSDDNNGETVLKKGKKETETPIPDEQDANGGKVAKSFEESKDKSKISKSKVAVDDQNIDPEIKEDVNDLVGVINKSLDSLDENDVRVAPLNDLKKSIKSSKSIDKKSLESFVDKYNKI